MRVLIAAHGYPPTEVGGAERRAARTAQALSERGHDVRVFAIQVGEGEASPPVVVDSDQDGILVRRLHLRPDMKHDPAEWEFDNPHSERVFRDLIDGWPPDLVHVFSGYLLSGSIARVALDEGIPTVLSLTDYWWMCHRITLVCTSGARCFGPDPKRCAKCRAEVFRRYRWPARVIPLVAERAWGSAGVDTRLGELVGVPMAERRIAALRSILQRIDACISPSRHVAEQYLKFGVDPARMHVWRQGAGIDSCRLRVPSATLRVGYIGQVRPHKGVHLLLDAWKMLTGDSPRRLTIHGSAVGDDDYERRIRAALAHLPDADWSGEFRGDEVWNVLANLDVVVAPSRWAENSPNAIIEAQAVGLPVVGARIGGIVEMVDDERTGMLFEPDDSADLAVKLQRLLDDPSYLKRLDGACKPFQTVETEIDKVESVYFSLLNPLVTR